MKDMERVVRGGLSINCEVVYYSVKKNCEVVYYEHIYTEVFVLMMPMKMFLVDSFVENAYSVFLCFKYSSLDVKIVTYNLVLY